ncbi:MAG: hypothetical protein ACXAD7_12940 [Candidatus Kariarchaeaceae archaeon]|jgi:hypothetical protein
MNQRQIIKFAGINLISIILISAWFPANFFLSNINLENKNPKNTINVKGESPSQSSWYHTYGGKDIDRATSHIQTTDGGFLVVGFTYSFGVGESDVWALKTDNNGNMLWNKTYGGEKDDRANSVIQTSDGGYAFAGWTSSFGNSSQEMYVIKTDHNGKMLWNQTYGGEGINVANGIIQTDDEDFILGGESNGNMCLIKTDMNGSVQWNRTYGGENDDSAKSLVKTNDGGFALAGYSRSFGFFTGAQYMWLVKTDSKGIVQWNRTYGGGTNVANELIQTNDDGFALVGHTDIYSDVNEGTFDRNAILVKTDVNGSMLWANTYGGESFDWMKMLVQTQNQDFVLAGETGNNIWMIKTDINGTEQWSKTHGGNYNDHVSSIVQTTDEGFVLSGWTISFGVSLDDMLLLKIDSSGHSLIEIRQNDWKSKIILRGFVVILLLLSTILVYLLYRRKKKKKKLLQNNSSLYPKNSRL